MGLIKDIRDIEELSVREKLKNKYGITEKDLTGQAKRLPLGIVLCVLEEQEKLFGEIKLDLLISIGIEGAFSWLISKDGYMFWEKISQGDYDEFYKKYPDYK